ncbi:MAG: hypothetical protein O2825_13720 [Proteobacteria bacterium]|nr:hypothetical protein [Pseudomonadota bacterium]
MDPATLVDLNRYPIDRLDDAAGQALLARARADLDGRALALLPGFLRPEAIAAMVAEAEPLEAGAHRRERERTAYGWMDNRGFPDGHPRRALHTLRGGSITRDMIPPEGPTAMLYAWPPLVDFVRRALGHETLYPCADPWLALEFHIEAEGDRFGWHYDTNDGVVSLLLRAPDEGGQFEYVPFIRDEDDENYDEVARVFAGSSTLVQRPAMAPGTFILFRGRRSIHRVSPVVRTRRPRLIALLSYDRNPGMVFPEATVRAVLNPSSEPHLGSHS